MAIGHRYLSLAAWYADDEVTARHHVDEADSITRTTGDQRALFGAFIQRAMVEGRWGDPALAARAIIDALAPIPEKTTSTNASSRRGVSGSGSTGRWRTAAWLLAHLDRVYERYEWTPLEQRYLVAAEFRRSIAAAAPTMAADELGGGPVLAAELVEELAGIT